MDHQNEGLGVKRVKLEETNNSIFPKETQHVLTISRRHETRTCLGFFMIMMCIEIKQCTTKFFTTFNMQHVWVRVWMKSKLKFAMCFQFVPHFISCFLPKVLLL
jgi:hypothetical protein